MGRVIKNGLMSLMIMAAVLAMALPVSAQRTDEFNVVMGAAIDANGQTAPNVQVAAADLNTALNDGNPATTPLVLDVRPYSEYVAGHVPGAINIYYRDLGKVGALNYLSTALAANVAAGKKNEIVVYGNTHHLSIMVGDYLKLAQGFPAIPLKWGFAAWTQDETVAPGRFKECTSFDGVGRGDTIATPGCTSNNFQTVTLPATNANTQSGNGYPVIDYISGTATAADLAEITRNTYDARFGDSSKPDFRITARELYDLLNDGNASNDPYVLSNRGTFWDAPTCTTPGAYYNKGHIPSAVAVDWCSGTNRQELRVLDATDFLPTDRLIVHHCWIGVSQQYGGLWYNLLGYTVASMDYGMNGWTTDSNVRQVTINPANWYTGTYAFETGPGTAYGTYSIPLASGWNLISLPVVPDDKRLSAVLAPISGNYNVVLAWIGGKWNSSTARRGALSVMTVDYGYWIDMNAPGILEVSGTVPSPTTIGVATGWNLVGYPSGTTQTLTSVLAPINYNVVLAWKNGKWNSSTARRGALSGMDPGYGYWIDANGAGSYVVTY